MEDGVHMLVLHACCAGFDDAGPLIMLQHPQSCTHCCDAFEGRHNVNKF